MTITLWDLRVDHPAGWQQLPTSRLKIKPFDLCSRLYRTSGYKCIAWSDDNLIAFSPVEQLLYSNAIDHTGNIQQPIYIVLPESPESHITVITPHVDSIRILEWSSLSCGLHLLSIDTRDRACVWKMKEGINDWVCVHECTMEHIIAAKWVNFCCEETMGNKGFPVKSAAKQFIIPPGTPCYFAVSAFTRITMCYYNAFEGWVSLTCDLSPTLGYVQGHLARADIITTKDGTVLIAVAGPGIGNTIGIYEMSFDLYTATLTGRLKSRIELSLPLPFVPPSILLSPIDGVPNLTHMGFDPASNGDVLITLVASLNPHYSPPVTGFWGLPEEGTSNAFIGGVQLERWEYKSIPTFQDRNYLLPLATLPAVKDNQTLTESAWVPTASVPLDLLPPPSPSSAPIHRSTTLTSHPEWVAGLNPFFPTLFRLVSRSVCIGFLGGGVEIRDIRTLAPSGVVDEMKNATDVPLHSSTLTMFGRSPPIPVSACFSPNGECIATLRYDASIRMMMVPKAARSVLRANDLSISKERNIADLLETSMMRGSDPWDIFARIYHNPDDGFLHLGVCDCHLVCMLAAQDLYALDDTHCRYYVPRWEPLRASLHALCPHTRNNLAYITSSARSFIYYLTDILRSSISLPISSSLVTPLNIEELLSHAYAPNVNLAQMFFPPNILPSLAPIEDWVMEFVTLMTRSLSLFVLEMTNMESRGISSTIEVWEPATIPGASFPYPDKPEPSVPGASGAARLTPELSLTTMASLTGPRSALVVPAPISPSSSASTCGSTAMETESLLSPSSTTPMEVSATLLTTESPDTTSSSSSIQPPSPSSSSEVVLISDPTPTPPPSISSSTPEIAHPPKTPPNNANNPFSPTPTHANPALNVTPSSTSSSSTSSSSTSRTSRSAQPNAGLIPTDYHFEFLSSVSTIDAPLASILFDSRTLQVLQNLIALVSFTSATPYPDKVESTHSVREMRSKFLFIGSIISKLQSIVEKDPNYLKIDFVEMLALRYAESLAEIAIPNSTAEDLRVTIANSLHSLNLDSPFTPIVHSLTTRPPSTPIFDVLHFVTFTPSDGTYKECLRCGRATRGNMMERRTGSGERKRLDAIWADRWGSSCPICNGKWVYINKK